MNIQTIQQNCWELIDETQDHWQWLAIGLCLVSAIGGSLLLNRTLLRKGSRAQRTLQRFFDPGKRVTSSPLIFSILLWITWAVRNHWSGSLVAKGHDPIPSGIIYTTALLVSAYAIYRLATAVSKGRLAPRLLGGGMLILFALHLFGWLEPLSNALRSVSLPLGDLDIHLWGILSAILSLMLLLWLVGLSTRFIDAALQGQTNVPPSIKVLIGKAARLCLYIAAVLGALKIGGVPLGGLAFFSGALGLGLGFGLQKIISNLVSGVIILLDKSIKPGDVVEIDGTYAWINSLRTRYISVITRDRKEILIPNEDFVTNKVVNWSFTDRNVRIKADVGVSYNSNIPEVIELCLKAIEDVPRVLKNPEPACLLMGFGDSSINLQLRFWINDPPQGVSNVKSAVLLAVWKAFKEHNIEIPFPQRDLHIRSGIQAMDIAKG